MLLWCVVVLRMILVLTTTITPHILIHSFVTTPTTPTHRRCRRRQTNRSVGRRNSHDNGGGDRGGGGSHHFRSWEDDHGIIRRAPNVTDEKVDTVELRGGGGGKLTKEKPTLLTSTTTYWRTMYHTVTSTMIRPFRLLRTKASNLMKSKETMEEEEMIRQIRTLKVQSVIVPNTTVLPQDVIDIAAKRTSLLGNPLRTEYVQDFAQSMKRWYVRRGFILHSVTGATLLPTTATVEIAVLEPVHHTVPIHITWYKEMIIDPDTGNVTTYRQYRDQHVRRRTFGWQDQLRDRRNLNVTYVPTGTSGHVRPSKIAQALRMIPGQPFQWDPVKWELVQQSGLFRKVLQITPRAVAGDDPSSSSGNRDNHAVQLHIVATEAPTKHLEYGVGKNLYHSGWEGELDFEHANILGGGETLGINVRRGTTDVQPSMRCRYSTGRLQETGGYDIEAFSEYIGGGGTEKTKPREQNDVATATQSDDGDYVTKQTAASGLTPANSHLDALFLDRRGATIRIKNPIDPNTIRNSVFSTSMERTLSSSGTYETIGSTTIEVGPFLKELPMNARSNFDLSITTGARFGSNRPTLTASSTVGENNENYETNSPIDDNVKSTAASLSLSSSSNSIIPYATMSATTRQLFPLLSGTRTTRNRSRRGRSIATTASNPISNSNNLSVSGGSTIDPFGSPQQQQLATVNNNGNEIGRPLILALKHTVIVSTNSIPQHVGKAIATSTNVRGNTIPDQTLTTALRGTTELRVPLHLPSFIPNEKMQQFFQQDANMVVYSDWLLSLKDNNRHDSTTSEDSNSIFRRKSCVGIGLRKNIQGIPLQCDVTYSNEGKLKAMFGLGRDFVF